MARTTLLLLLLFSVLLAAPAMADGKADEGQPDASLLGGPFDLVFRAGYSGLSWSPLDMEPYDIAEYGRRMLYAEIALEHPLIALGDIFDVIQVPRFRVETNFSYSVSSYNLQDLVPAAARSTPYIKTSGWLTLFDAMSLRYREEKFKATLTDPEGWELDPWWTHYNYVKELIIPARGMTNRMRDLEIGYISTPKGQYGEGSWELGFYFSSMTWPKIVQNPESGSQNDWVLTQEEILAYGGYAALNNRPVEGSFPLRTQLMIRLGHMVGLDARVAHELNILKSWHLGAEIEGSYRAILAHDQFDRQEEKQYRFNVPQDLRYRFALYTMFEII